MTRRNILVPWLAYACILMATVPGLNAQFNRSWAISNTANFPPITFGIYNDKSGCFVQGGTGTISGVETAKIRKINSSGTELWVYDLGSVVLRDVVTDGSCNVYALTLEIGSGTVAVHKLTSSGTLDWGLAQMGTGIFYDAFDIELDGAGNIYVAGQIADQNSIPVQSDLWVAKISSAGGVIWQKTYDGPLNLGDAGQDVEVDGNGNVYVMGFSSYYNDPVPGFVYPVQNPLLAKWDASGNFQWAVAEPDGVFFDVYPQGLGIDNRLVINASGNLITITPNLYSTSSLGFTGSAIREYSPSGSRNWETGIADAELKDVQLTTSGKIVVNGYISQPGSGLENFYVASFSSGGALQWQKIINGPNNMYDECVEVATDAAGNVYAAGSYTYTTQYVCDASNNCNTEPISAGLVLKIDTNGTINWQDTLQLSGFTDVWFNSNGDLYCTGLRHTMDYSLGVFNWSLLTVKYTPGSIGTSFGGELRVGPGETLATPAAAISFLNGKHLLDAVTFRIKPGTYSGALTVDGTVNFTRASADIPVRFAPVNPEADVVTITAASVPLKIQNKNYFSFSNIDFTCTGSSTAAVWLDNADNVWIYGAVITGNANCTNGLRSTGADNLTLTEVTISGCPDAVLSETGTTGLKAVFSTLNSTSTGFKLTGNSNFELRNNSITVTPQGSSSYVGFSLTSNTGTNYITGNTVTGRTDFITNNAAIEFSGNTLTYAKASEYVLDVKGNTNTIQISENQITGNSTASGIRVNCDAGSDPNCGGSFPNTPGKVLVISGNTLTTGGEGIKCNSIPHTTLTVHNNTINATGMGVYAKSLANNNNSMLIAGNFIKSPVNNMKLEASDVTTNIRNNTFVTAPTGGGNPPDGIYLQTTNNLNFCGNNAHHTTNGTVVKFHGNYTPANSTYTWNNWYANNNTTVSNKENLILVATNTKVNPLFTSATDFTLTYQSPLLNQAITCTGDWQLTDLRGNLRESLFDIGCYENPNTQYDGTKVSFLLKDGFEFQPGAAQFFQFEISGLTNYTNVDLKVYNKTGTMVYQSTSKTTFWQGVDMNTGQLVEEGGYTYQLDLDGTKLGGLIYVNRQ